MEGFRQLTSKRVAAFVGRRFFSTFDYVRDPLKFQASRVSGCLCVCGVQGRERGVARGCLEREHCSGYARGRAPARTRLRRPACPPVSRGAQAALECLSFCDYSFAIKCGVHMTL